MATFKCKMCGGALEITDNQTTAVCEYCGTKQTLPKLDDEKRANLYDRANHFRRNNEFDKASSIYESILNEDSTDAEAYWSLVLCRYGIEYVKDPATKKRVPTVNRAQFTSIFDDDNYKSALSYADAYQKSIYEEEANTINEIQKGILAISQKEEPFDVFICYKETDNNGRRTPDSVLANDLYHQLTAEGFKVFFARITLEDKLGVAYEPYIFAALNSSKVMVVLGTKPEYFNAVWVKNEWSRYLALVNQSGGKKILIPAYKDMDPYDLPDEFSHLQAQDMSKLGFMQDLIRGITKLAQTEAPEVTVKETVVVEGNAAVSTAPLLKRAFMYLEDREWEKADEYCEKVLDMEPENAEAYLGKLLAYLGCRKKEDLKDESYEFDENNMYKKVMRFAAPELQKELQGYNEYIMSRNIKSTYNRALGKLNAATTEEECDAAAEIFNSISGFLDADRKKQECLQKKEEIHKDEIYKSACEIEGNKNTITSLENAIKTFSKITGWRDADEHIRACQKRIDEINAEKERERIEREQRLEQERLETLRREKRNTKIALIVMGVIVMGIAIFIIFNNISSNIKKQNMYEQASQYMDEGNYSEAISVFDELGDYEDSEDKLRTCMKQNLKNSDVGSSVLFGTYEQDNSASNGEEIIEWIVLAKEENLVFLVSKYCLDSVAYNEEYTDITWEKCTLRAWLNDDFLNTAFTAEEQQMIIEARVPNSDNPEYGTSGGNDTTDKVFLLSIDEANTLFSSDTDRQAAATAYAIAQGAYVNENGCAWWWLRSPGYDSYGAADVTYDGGVNGNGYDVNYSGNGVRPALIINLES